MASCPTSLYVWIGPQRASSTHTRTGHRQKNKNQATRNISSLSLSLNRTKAIQLKASAPQPTPTPPHVYAFQGTSSPLIQQYNSISTRAWSTATAHTPQNPLYRLLSVVLCFYWWNWHPSCVRLHSNHMFRI